jgi:hypothetical protein
VSETSRKRKTGAEREGRKIRKKRKERKKENPSQCNSAALTLTELGGNKESPNLLFYF